LRRWDDSSTDGEGAMVVTLPDRWAHRLTVRRLRREAFERRPRWPKSQEDMKLDRELARVFEREAEKEEVLHAAKPR
jgi:hypothetical protein